jgi:hypothetical protein
MEENNGSRGGDRPAVSMRTMEIVVAGLLLAIGAVVAYDSYRLGARWGDDGPQSGYFPFYIGLLVAVSSLVTLVQALGGRLPGSEKSFVDRGALRQVLAVLLPAAGYVLGIQLVGIYLASAVYITVFMVWLGGYSWFKSVTLGLGVSVATFLMFEVWFKVALHKGSWFNPLSLIGY